MKVEAHGLAEHVITIKVRSSILALTDIVAAITDELETDVIYVVSTGVGKAVMDTLVVNSPAKVVEQYPAAKDFVDEFNAEVAA
jgi:hypothetical protein